MLNSDHREITWLQDIESSDLKYYTRRQLKQTFLCLSFMLNSCFREIAVNTLQKNVLLARVDYQSRHFFAYPLCSTRALEK